MKNVWRSGLPCWNSGYQNMSHKYHRWRIRATTDTSSTSPKHRSVQGARGGGGGCGCCCCSTDDLAAATTTRRRPQNPPSLTTSSLSLVLATVVRVVRSSSSRTRRFRNVLAADTVTHFVIYRGYHATIYSLRAVMNKKVVLRSSHSYKNFKKKTP